jgi:hypothetical protein
MLVVVLDRYGGTVWRRRGVQSKVTLVAVLSAPLVAMTIVIKERQFGAGGGVGTVV